MEPSVLLCARVSNCPTPLQGAIQIACEDCDRMVWVAKAGQAHLRKETDVSIVCVQCGFIRIKNHEAEAIVRPVDGAEAEYIDNFLNEVFP